MKMLLLAFAILLVGCNDPSPRSSNSDILKSVTYARDYRTNICFAVLRFSGYNTTGLSITTVPCEADVMGLINK